MEKAKQILKDVFTPNKVLDKKVSTGILILWILCTFQYWVMSESKFIPEPSDVLQAAHTLIAENGLIRGLIESTWLCFKAMGYAVVISLFIAYLSVIPFFRPFVAFMGKQRFLTTIGLTFIFAQVLPDTGSQKLALLIFGISVFLVTSAASIVMGVTKEELDHARTLKQNEWQALWEVIIVGKADQMLEAIRQNFAIAWMMLAMVENICRAEGGIGVILTDQNKHFHLDAVYAIQIIVLLTGIFCDWLLGVIRQMFCPYAYLTLDRK